MRTQTGSRRYILAGADFASQYERRVREMQRQLDADEKADQMRRAYDQAMRRASGVGSDRPAPNVVGGSLDGRRFLLELNMDRRIVGMLGCNVGFMLAKGL